MISKQIEIDIDGIHFTCFLEAKRISFYRRMGNYLVWDEEIELGHAKVNADFTMLYNKEIQSNLELYRKALDKVKKLKAFL